MDEHTTLQVLRQEQDLQAFQPAWEALWRGDPRATPFSHPAWLLPWWHSFAQPALRVATAWCGGTLQAMLPLYVLERAEERTLLLLGAGTSDYLDAVVAPGFTNEQMLEFVRRALAEPGWTAAHLNQLRADSRLRATLPQLGLRAEPYAGETCSGCPAMPVARLPRKLRAEVLYFRNAALSHGRLRLVQSDTSQLADTFALLVRFHTAGWQARGEPGVLADPAVLQHHTEALPRLHAAGLLRLMRLELEGNPIAVLYSLLDPPGRSRRTQYFYLMGHAPEWNALRPGILLCALAAEHAAAEGVEWIDMLRGQETYKQFWHVQPEPTYGFCLHPERG